MLKTLKTQQASGLDLRGVFASAWLVSRDHLLFSGVSSKQENGKVFRVSNVIRFRVDRRDHSSIVTCEATHPALHGQRKQTQYVLDVQCK